MAGRLRGTAFQVAMNLKMVRLDLTTGQMREMKGDELLAQPSHDAWMAPNGELFAAETAGASVLMQALIREFEVQDQDMSVVALDSFFSLFHSFLENQ